LARTATAVTAAPPPATAPTLVATATAIAAMHAGHMSGPYARPAAPGSNNPGARRVGTRDARDHATLRSRADAWRAEHMRGLRDRRMTNARRGPILARVTGSLSSAAAAATAAAGRALASGDALRALAIAGRMESALGLTLRGIAYAQLGDLELARASLERAASLDGDPVTRARARAALVEVALGAGDPKAAARDARASASELERLGDARNAAMQRLVLARAEVLLGRLGEARRIVDVVLSSELPEDVRAVAFLAQAETAIRAVAATEARRALARVRAALDAAPNRLLARALAALERELSLPLARVVRGGAVRPADLFAIEAASRGDALLVDACRRLAIGGRLIVPLARRPSLFALLLALARAWPASVPRDALLEQALGARRINASHRARLRVEIGRLRKVMDDLGAEPVATETGYALVSKRDVEILLPPSDDEGARVALLLGDGASWSAKSLAEHAAVSKSTARRALAALVEGGSVVRTGAGNGVRYARVGTPIASRMLLLGLVPRGAEKE